MPRLPLELAADREAWRQQPEESDRMYARFLNLWCKQPPYARKPEHVLKKLRDEGVPITPGSVRRIICDYSWTARVRSYDELQREADHHKHQARVAKWVDQCWETSDRLMEAAMDALDDVKIVSGSDLARLVAISIELRARAIALTAPPPEDTTRQTLLFEEVTTMSMASRQTRIAEIVKDLDRRKAGEISPAP